MTTIDLHQYQTAVLVDALEDFDDDGSGPSSETNVGLKRLCEVLRLDHTHAIITVQLLNDEPIPSAFAPSNS